MLVLIKCQTTSYLGAATVILQYLPCAWRLRTVCQQQARGVDVQCTQPFLRRSAGNSAQVGRPSHLSCIRWLTASGTCRRFKLHRPCRLAESQCQCLLQAQHVRAARDTADSRRVTALLIGHGICSQHRNADLRLVLKRVRKPSEARHAAHTAMHLRRQELPSAFCRRETRCRL